MRKSKPINWFKLVVRILAALVLLCCVPSAGLIIYLLIISLGEAYSLYPGMALCLYLKISILSLILEITPDRIKRFSLVTGIVFWISFMLPLFILIEPGNSQIFKLSMYLSIPLVIAGFYLLLSRILLYFAEKQEIAPQIEIRDMTYEQN